MHNLTLEGGKLTATEITEVVEFDDKEVKLRLGDGFMLVKGDGIEIQEFSKGAKHLALVGTFSSVSYTKQAEKVPFIKRILK